MSLTTTTTTIDISLIILYCYRYYHYATVATITITTTTTTTSTITATTTTTTTLSILHTTTITKNYYNHTLLLGVHMRQSACIFRLSRVVCMRLYGHIVVMVSLQCEMLREFHLVGSILIVEPICSFATSMRTFVVTRCAFIEGRADKSASNQFHSCTYFSHIEMYTDIQIHMAYRCIIHKVQVEENTRRKSSTT